MLQSLRGICLLLISWGCFAQWNPSYTIEISPPDPQPGEALRVFLRGTDPSGQVVCPAARQRIIAVSITDRSILLQLSNIGSGGGFLEPYCDGNTFQFGPLPEGEYELTAGVLLQNLPVRPVATAQLKVAPLPNGRNYTALWGTASEQGWGLNVTHQGDASFATLFVYDDSGAPLWLVMPAGMRQANTNTFSGDLYRTTGSPYDASMHVPLASKDVARVGSMSLAFDGAHEGTLTYSVDGRTITKALGKAVFGSRPANCGYTTESLAKSANYQALWWNEYEPGWGLNLTQQDNILFGTLFTYGPNRQPLWLVMLGGRMRSDREYVGNLYQTTGPAFHANVWSDAEIVPVGEMRLQFQDGSAGSLEYTVKDITVRKPITRQVFGNLVPSCK